MMRLQVSRWVVSIVGVLLLAATAFAQTGPEPAGWFAGDMHVHRSCGGSPESVSTMFSYMTPQNVAVECLLADMGNGEVQNPTTDLPLVNGQNDPISTSTRLLHWDAEWHWDATYKQYAHQALGGHLVGLGLSNAKQMWQESTYSILDWMHQQNGVAGFAHLQYLDSGFPSSLTCCTPIEYPVETALGISDFISEDVDSVNSGRGMNPENFLQAYYRLLNSGFRPGFAAGTDYPCGTSVGSLVTYAQVAGGQLTYRNFIDAISRGRTVVSRNGHVEFLLLTVNGTATPGDEIQMATGSVTVNVQWTATQNLSGIIEIVQNGTVVASQSASASPGTPGTFTVTIPFAKSGWLAARRVATSGGEHYVHTAAVFVTVNNAPVRASAADAQFYVDWMNSLLQNTASGGPWNSFYPTQLSLAQSRYQAASALFQQIVAEASGTAPTLSSIALTPVSSAVAPGSIQQFTATGTYSNGTTINLTGQARWSSSVPAVATISLRGLTSALANGTTTISATLGGITGSTTLRVLQNPVAISTSSLPGGTAGVAYNATLTATGGTTPYAWAISGGALPAGLSLNTSTGVITGTPTTAGTSTFTARVTDSSSPQQTATAVLSIVVSSSGGVSCPCSIWRITTQPSVADSGPDSSVEIGVKFRTDVAGYITGLRFYKGVGNTGSHVGNLWNSSGTRLATVTFSGETSSGWQQANFSSPVAVNANTTYVASYHAPAGHYSDDTAYFVTAVDNAPLHALADGTDGSNGVYAYGSSSSFPSSGWQSSNYWVDIIFTTNIGPDTTPPTVSSVSPANGTANVNPGTAISATFSEALDPTTINANTFQLFGPGNTQITGTVTYINGTATFQPAAVLATVTTYSAVLLGGGSGIKDLAGNAMTSNYTWSFTTSAPPSDQGPGGPILVISSVANPFSRYYGEMLTAEGLNEYKVSDILNVTASTLNSYDVVILGDFALTATQASMLASWVNNGGKLIAMHPDKQLAGLLGLAPTTSTMANAYLAVQTSTGPGVGIVGQTIQYHGSADLYTLAGATSFATLYSNASTPTTYPGVTLANSGAGQAAAFTYDLARSVVYTRQGNPAWSGQQRDGQIPPIRSDDLYFGDASFDPEPDWVDLNKVSIPQADEQQRLLANLILQMNASRKPLPRFWYLPSGFKAAVVLTGDDHGSFYSGSSTSQRFNDGLAASPTGCSVADWQCVRATAYLFPAAIASNPLTDSQAAAYTAQGFELSVHADSEPTCSDWTTSNLDSFYTTLLASLAAQFPSLPAPKTHRMHCISWSDYDSQPQVELKHGIRLDTSYYYWPPTWVNDQPGMFTGSGMPMRFTDRNGNLIDVYQATTQMTDESGQTYPFNTDTLLANAVGAAGYYGVFVVNAHNDQGSYPGIAPYVVSSAQGHGVPVISALQLLTWLDGRNSSSFGSLTWSSNTLSFSITQAPGARNLRAMLPTSGRTGTLSSITSGGNSVSFTTQTIKGISYAVFNAATGSYLAVYGAPPPVTLGSVSLNPISVTGGNSSSGTVTLTGPAPTGGATVALSSGNTAVAQVSPASVTVAAGQTSATFSVTTASVTSTTQVTISGTYPTGTTQTATLTVTPAVTVSSVSLNPTSVTGGTSSTGTVTLNAAASGSGAVVVLSSSDTSAATVPASVTVSAGSTSATFTVTTTPVAAVSTAVITASYSGSASATITVNPPVASSVVLNPTSVAGGTGSTGTVTLNGPAPTGGALVTLASDNTAAAQVPGSVTVAANATSATFSITTSVVSVDANVTISATYGTAASATLTVTAPAATLISLTLNPSSLIGGNSSTATVTLSRGAPVGGATVTLSSNNAAAQVPPNVSVAAGSTTATFSITTTAVAATVTANISATYGAVQSSALTVNPPNLTGVALNPTTVQGGSSSSGTVTLNGVAPSGGAVVTLSSNSSSAQVPASVTVAAGSTTATFTVTTSVVASTTSATITGTYGATQTAVLTINAAAPSLASVTLNPTSVTGGTSSTGTVTLTGVAPSGGAVVTLSSNSSSAQVPPSVTVAAGATTATFTVTTSVVSSSTSATITGTYGATQTAVLTVNPASAALASVTLNPTSVTGGTSSTGTVTLTAVAPSGGAVVVLASGNTAVAQVPASVTVAAGAMTATFTVTTSAVTTSTNVTVTGTYGTQSSATLTVNPPTFSSLSLSPTSLAGGNSSTGTVRLSGPAPTGGIPIPLSSNNTAVAQVPASVTVAAGATTATFTVTTTPITTSTQVVISGTYGVTRNATLTVNAPTLSSVTRSPSSVVGGNNSTGTVTLNGPAPAGGVVVTLQSNNTVVAQVPVSVSIAAGSRTATFTITTTAVATQTSVTISATYGATRTTTLTVTVASLSSLTLNPSTVTGGQSSTGTLTLNGAAPPNGAVVSLSSSNTTAAQVPATATIPAGSQTVTFTVTTGAVHGTSSTIRGTYRSTTRSARLTVQ